MPNVILQIEKDIDHWHKWEGEGRDPRVHGFQPYEVTITATMIVNGEFVVGQDSITGIYLDPGMPIVGSCNGYLPQMVKEAIGDLQDKLPTKYEFTTEELLSHYEVIEGFNKLDETSDVE